MKTRLKENFVLKIVSVIIAIILWVAVQTTINPQIEWTVKADVDFSNYKILEDNRDLYIVDRDKYSVNVKVRGTLIDLMLRKPDDCIVKCDVASINVPGFYEDLNFVCTSASGKLKYEIINSKENKEVNIQKKTELTIPVKVAASGSVRDGFYTAEEYITADETTVTVKGFDSDISRISSAVASVKLNGKSESFSELCVVELYDSDGNVFEPVYSDVFTATVREIKVSGEVFEKKKLDIEVKGISDTVEYEIEPPSVEIAGKKEDTEKLKKLTVEDFRLSSVEKGHKQEINLKIPEGIILVDKVNPEITVIGEKNEEDN